MGNNRLIYGASANFEDCFEVIRVDAETGKCDFLKQCAEHTLIEPIIGEYFTALSGSGWIFPEDHEIYSGFFELGGINERLKSGRLILNSIRVKPADSYIWTDIELVRPECCPQYFFVCIKDLKRKSRPAPNGFKLLMRTNVSGKTVYPITAPLGAFGEIVDLRAVLERYIGSFGLNISEISGEAYRESRSADGFTLVLEADPEGITAAVYEDGAVSEERLEEILSRCRKIDPKTGLYTGYYAKINADKSEGDHIGTMLIRSEGVSYDKALMILRRDHEGFAFARGAGELAVVLADSESRLRYEFGALCRRLLDTGGDFELYTALSARPASAEEVLRYAENSRPQTPGDFRWSAAGEAVQNMCGSGKEKAEAYR